MAFQQAQPAIAWKLTQELLSTARTLLTEAAKARFQVNFGTEVCDRCEGLRAGEGVVATCYQVKLCYYDNVKSLTHKQKKVLQGLTKSSLPTAP